MCVCPLALRRVCVLRWLYQALHKYCPHWCIRGSVLEGTDEMPAGGDKDEKLTLLQWMVASDRYALAMAACPNDGMSGPAIWPYEAAMAHKAICLEVGKFSQPSPFLSVRFVPWL